MYHIKNNVFWAVVAGTVAILSMLVFNIVWANHGFITQSVSCSGFVNIYFDSNGNKIVDDNDKKINPSKYRFNNKLYLPKGSIIKVSGTCVESGTYHWCSNTGTEQRSTTKEIYITVSKVSPDCTPTTTTTDYLQVIPRIDSSSRKSELLDVYKNNLFTDITLTSKYSNPDFNFFDVPTYLIPDINTPMGSQSFERYINDIIMQNIFDYLLRSGYVCSKFNPSSALMQISCFKDEEIRIGNTTRTIRRTYDGVLALESLYNELRNRNLIDINVLKVTSVSWDCPSGGSQPTIIGKNVKQAYIEEPGFYSCVYSPFPSQGNNKCLFIAS